MTDFEHEGWTVPAGQKDHRTIGSVTLSNGSQVGVPAVVLNGREDGPTFVVVGTTHGQEIVGAGAILSLMSSLDPETVRGTVIGLPVMNPLAMEIGSYASPQDSVNMTAPIYWPGNRHGMISERLGAIIGAVLERADFYADIHGCLEPSVPMSMMFLQQAKDAATTAGIRKLGDAFGVTPVDMTAVNEQPGVLGVLDGYPAAVLAARGVPTLMLELTSCRTLADADRGASGLRNLLRASDMLDGEPEQLDAVRLPGEYRYHSAIQTDVAGLMWVREQPGAMLDQGQVFIELTDLFGQPVGDVRAPEEGFAWAYAGTLQGVSNHAVPEGTVVAPFAQKVG